MKNFFFIHALVCMSLILSTHNLFCQNISKVKILSVKSTETVATDNNSALPVNTSRDFRNAIHIRAVRSFVKNFRKAENVSWRIALNGNFIADFTNDSVQTIVEYNTRGLWNYTLKRYAGNKLPESVRLMIKRNYGNYMIKHAAESKCWQNRESVVYNIAISNGNNIKILTIYNAEMKITTDLTVQKDPDTELQNIITPHKHPPFSNED